MKYKPPINVDISNNPWNEGHVLGVVLSPRVVIPETASAGTEWEVSSYLQEAKVNLGITQYPDGAKPSMTIQQCLSVVALDLTEYDLPTYRPEFERLVGLALDQIPDRPTHLNATINTAEQLSNMTTLARYLGRMCGTDAKAEDFFPSNDYEKYWLLHQRNVLVSSGHQFTIPEHALSI